MTEQEIYTQFGNRLRELREKSGLTQTQVAEMIGTSTAFVSMSEKGQKVSLSRLYQMLDCLGYEIDFHKKNREGFDALPKLQVR